MKSIDIRSEAAVNLLAEFLDMDMGNNGGGRKNAEHFAHGEFLFCFVFIVTFIFPACSWSMIMGAWAARLKVDKHLLTKPIVV
jgi:hypothetical protein